MGVLDAPALSPTKVTALAQQAAGLDLVADPTKADGTAVNSTYLQSLLDTAGVVRVRVPRGANGASWVLNTPLVLSSGQTLDCTGAAFTYPAGTAGQFVTNDARISAVATTRDTKITLVGGTFNRPPNITSSYLDAMNIMFAFVDGLEVRGVRVTSTGDQRYATTERAYGGKYSVYLYNCTQAEVHHCDFAVCSDGVHATGATKNLHVHHITGTTGDDAVAIMPRDNPAWEISGQGFGDLENILVENITNTSPNNGVKILVGKSNDGATRYNARRVVIRNVDGSHASAVWIGGDTNYTYLSGGQVQNLTIADVTERASGAPAVRFYHDQTSLVRGAKVTRAVSLTGPAVSVLDCPVDDLTVADCAFDTASSSVPMILFGSTAVVNRLTVRDCRVRFTGTAPGSSPLVVPSGASLTSLYVDGLETSGTAWSIGDLSTVTDVVAHKVRSTDQSGYVRVGSGGALTVRGAEMRTAGTDANRIDSGGSITPLAAGWRGDVTQHIQTAFGAMFNTNASAGCGAGPVVFNGTDWKHSVTGATYTPPAGPAAPTATGQAGNPITASIPSPASGVTVQWFRSTAAGTKGSALSGATSATLSDSSGTVGTAYYYTATVTNSRGSADSNQLGPFTLAAAPTTFPALSTTPLIRLEADSITGVSDGGAVSSWPAVTGTAASVPSNATAPTLIASAVNGKPAVKFTGASNQHLFAPASHKSESMAVFFVYRVPTVSTTGQVVGWSSTDGTDRIGLGMHINIDSSHGQRLLIVGSGNPEADASGPSSNTWALGWVSVGAATAHTVASSYNGGTPGTATPTGYTAASAAGFALAGNHGTNDSTVDVAAFLVGAFTAADLAKLGQYYGARYGLTVGAN